MREEGDTDVRDPLVEREKEREARVRPADRWAALTSGPAC